jgi:transposase
MERLEKKIINGKAYYYCSKWGRVDGKSKRIWQKYLGKLENIVKAVEGNISAPQYGEIFQFGLPMTLWEECCRASIVKIIDKVCPKRSQGLSVGKYIAIAAINRAIHPVSKNAMFDWFSRTTLSKHLPDGTRTNLTSQKFWNHMDRIGPSKGSLIWQNIITNVIDNEQIDLSSVSYDGTNFYTFIDTFNSRCSLAKRGKNKQGRTNLRQVSYALFCSADRQIPLFYDIYEGNRNDAKQFPIMLQKFHDFIKSNLKTEVSTSKITLVFDKGNNSKDNFSLVDQLKLSYVGSVKLGENVELTTISNGSSRFEPCQAPGLESTKSFRVTKKIYGKERTLIVAYNQRLFNTQWLTFQNDIAKAVSRLSELEQRLNDRAAGIITKGKSPTVESVNKQSKEILSRQYMKDVIKYEVKEQTSKIPILSFEIDNDAVKRVSDTYLGKNIIISDRSEWSDDKIILAYRSQFNIENVFKEMKDREIGSWWPLHHWTNQKIQVHGLYCTIALLLRALAYRRVRESGIKISMKRMLSELADIKEIMVVYAGNKKKKTRYQVVQSKTSELQQSLLSILNIQKEENPILG